MRSPIEFAETLGSIYEVYNRRGMLLQESADRHRPQTDTKLDKAERNGLFGKPAVFWRQCSQTFQQLLVSVYEWQNSARQSINDISTIDY